ncbi:MAG: PKD domain-containing protein [Thermoplasmata archaeon]|nr:PKD domain-containing protein [Thermoplasmata archaeon]
MVLPIAALVLVLSPALAVGSAPGASGGIALKAAGVSPAAIGLSWLSPSSGSLLFSGYEVDRSTNGSSGPWTPVATIGNFLGTSLFQDGLSPGGHYWWRVIMGQTGLSSVTSNVLAQTQPVLPTLSATLVGGTAANLSWTNRAVYGSEVGFVSYTVLESVSAGGLATVAGSSTESDRSLTVNGLHAGTSYAFEVNVADGCQNASNCASYPSPSVASSNEARVSTPGGLTATIVSAPTTLAQGFRGSFACLATGGTSPRLYDWNFGDGATAAGRNASHIFTSPGAFVVTCLVHDAVGGNANATASLTVSGNATSPTNRSDGSGGTHSTPGGGSTSPLASTSTPFAPVVSAVIALAFLGAVVWLAIQVVRRRRGARGAPNEPRSGPPPGAVPTLPPPPEGYEAVTAAPGPGPPPDPSPPGAPRDLDELMDQLDGLPSAGR